MRVCELCGADISNLHHMKSICEQCKEEQTKIVLERRELRKVHKKKVMSINVVNKLAKQAGMSYGRYVAIYKI